MWVKYTWIKNNEGSLVRNVPKIHPDERSHTLYFDTTLYVRKLIFCLTYKQKVVISSFMSDCGLLTVILQVTLRYLRKWIRWARTMIIALRVNFSNINKIWVNLGMVQRKFEQNVVEIWGKCAHIIEFWSYLCIL